MKKEEIEAFLSEPIKVGDKVYVRGLGIQDKNKLGNTSIVEQVLEDDSIFIKKYNELIKVNPGDYKKYTDHIGYDPIAKKLWSEGLRVFNFNLYSIVHSFFNVDSKSLRTETVLGKTINELEWEPFFINEQGEEIVYQRDFCWNLRDKQLLIDSIYNGIDIGKIIVRKRDWNWVESRVKENKKAALSDIVDGKQRLKAIFEFISNEFPDSSGFYWDDFSKIAQSRFLDFQAVSYGEIQENAKDEDVKKIFLNVNFTGVQMSQEHIDFVRNINL